jgi:hypothetical protein
MAKAKLGDTFLTPAFDNVTTVADTTAASKANTIHIRLRYDELFGLSVRADATQIKQCRKKNSAPKDGCYARLFLLQQKFRDIPSLVGLFARLLPCQHGQSHK